jgi:hypothetical protein
VTGERALSDYRGQTIVLLVFFRLPDSLEHLSRLSTAYFDLRVLGVEVIGVPLEGARALYRTLGPRPLLFPFVVGGGVPPLPPRCAAARPRGDGRRPRRARPTYPAGGTT